eukprot:TRINITY_DN742_c2_g1_i6.p2 TRINITY_DN742_c2_g1~~TRINITY_DN742_c2_g1_i6.p2  ORF type:complete len:5800 (+),score=1627.99 TRINITY_DN742_c2_g1_i6:20670-38069(+)
MQFLDSYSPDIAQLFGVPPVPGRDLVNILYAGYGELCAANMGNARKSCLERGTWDAIVSQNDSLLLFKGSEVRIWSNLSYFCCHGADCVCGANVLEALKELYPLPYEYPPGTVVPDSWKVLYLNTFITMTTVKEVFGTDSEVVAAAAFTGYPTILFSEYLMLYDGKETLISEVFDLSMPYSLQVDTEQAASVVTTSNSDILAYTLSVRNKSGRRVGLNNDKIYAVLQQCGRPLTAQELDAVTILQPRVDVNLTSYLWDNTDCVDTTVPVLGDTVLAITDNTVSFSLAGLGIASSGWYKFKFIHVKSKLVAYSKAVNVVTSDCTAESFNECRVTCTPPFCSISISANMQWVLLYVKAKSRSVVDFTVQIVQPCCNNHGLCCAGDTPCTEHTDAALSSYTLTTTRCDCYEDPANGYWDQRLHSNCSFCKTGYTGSDCRTFDGPQVPTEGAGYLPLGDNAYYVFRTQPETEFTAEIVSHTGDADLYVTFLGCPGQTAGGRLQKGEISQACSGRGECVLQEDGTTACICDSGYTGADCSQQCCWGRGECSGTGDECSVCFADAATGYWNHSNDECDGSYCDTHGVNVYPTTECMYVDENKLFAGCTANTSFGGYDDPMRVWLQWREVKAPGAIYYSAIRMTLDATPSCPGQRVVVYATQPENIPLKRNSTGQDWPADVIPCGVYMPYPGSNCGNGVYNATTAQCECKDGLTCLRGICSVPDSISCIDGTCRQVQRADDEVDKVVCEGFVCVAHLHNLEYTWTAAALEGLSPAAQLDSNHELQWIGYNASARFYGEVGSYTHYRSAADEVLDIDITYWMQLYVSRHAHEYADLSFVLVTEGDVTCRPRYKKAELVLQKEADHAPNLLLVSVEDTTLSALQGGQPYYKLKSSTTDDVAADSFYLHRYVTNESRWGWCGNGTCECDMLQEATYQDPTDFVQVGDHVYFLATTDWETQQGDSAPCGPVWGEAGEVFQGAREIMYSIGRPTEVVQGSEAHNHTYCEFKQGRGVYPDFGASQPDLRDQLLGMRLFTMAKDLIKMPSNAKGQNPEMLVFCGASNGGTPVVTELGVDEQPTVKSSLAPQLWRLLLSPGYGKFGSMPVGPPELIALNVIFPSYPTYLRVGPEDLVFLLGEENNYYFNDSQYAPSSIGYGGKKAPYMYPIPTRIGVWCATGGPAKAVQIAKPAVTPVPAACEHGQGHPGFVVFKGQVYFHYDDGTGMQLWRWNRTMPMAHVIKLNHQGKPLVPSLPPLNRGYFKPAVMGGRLLLSLGLADGVSRSSGDCLYSPCSRICHTYQNQFKCVDPNRGNVGLWAWDGVDGLTPTAGYSRSNLTDPKWLTPTANGEGVFYVVHEGGITNLGVHLTTDNDTRYPQLVEGEKEVLVYARFTGGQLWIQWEHDVAGAYGFTEWNEKILYWSYNTTEVDGGYNDEGACYPPGRLQDVATGTTVTKLMTGVNIPAYDGCSRVLYSVPLYPRSWEEPSPLYVGGSEDGVGVPNRHCCREGTFSVADPELQPSLAGSVCDSGDVGCITDPNGAVSMPRGCLKCTLPSDGTEAFIYPTGRDIAARQYSLTSQWDQPHSGWWFAGYHSLWVDPRSGSASGTAINADGSSKNGNIQASDMYRVGGFAWREGWPRVIGVMQAVVDPVRPMCEDCEQWYYGPDCGLQCPVPVDSYCTTLEIEACDFDVACHLVNGTCLALPCRGFPCFDGVHGNGTCNCGPTRSGMYCEDAAGTTSVTEYRVAGDATASLVLCDGVCGPAPPRCTDGCTGTVTTTEPCCGRSASPYSLSTAHVAVFSWMDIRYPPTEQAVASTLFKVYQSTSSPCEEAVALQLYDISTGHTWLRHEGGSWVEQGPTADETDAMFSGDAVMEVPVQNTVFGHETVFDIAHYLNAKWGSAPALRNLTLGLKVKNGTCRPMFLPREYHDDWKLPCEATGCTVLGSAVPGYQIKVSNVYSPLLQVVSASAATELLHSDTTPLPPPEVHLYVEHEQSLDFTPDAVARFEAGELCERISTNRTETCSLMTPLNTGFAVVRVLAFRTTNYSISVAHTKRGLFATPQSGLCVNNDWKGHWSGAFCLECDFRYNGDTCTTYVSDCTAENCHPSHGVCVPNYEVDNKLTMCKCHTGFYGINCTRRCLCEHGDCSAGGVCSCHASEALGFWAGDMCNECNKDFWGANCLRRCSCKHGVCDPLNGNCLTGTCAANWAGPDCSVCQEGFYGTLCTETCADCVAKNGRCSGGQCICDTDNMWSPSAHGCVLCNASVVCNGIGACLPFIEDPEHPCTCPDDDVRGHWDPATNCTTCSSMYWGETCMHECRCNLRGVCDMETGACICFNDAVHGHYGGERCDDCAEGFTGASCYPAVSGSGPMLSRPFRTRGWDTETDTFTGTGAVLHVASGLQDFVFASVGETNSKSLFVKAWTKAYSQSVDFGESAHTVWSVHATNSDGESLGSKVLDFIHVDGYLYTLVDAQRPYIARVPLSDGMHLFPNTTSGLPAFTVDEGADCAHQTEAAKFGGCPAGTEVVYRLERAMVYSTRTTGTACIMVLSRRACSASECSDLCQGMLLAQMSDLKPVRSVAMLVNTTQLSYDIVDWWHMQDTSVYYNLVVVLLESQVTDGTATPLRYIMKRVALQTLHVHSQELELTAFSPSRGVVSMMYTSFQGGVPFTLVFGEVNELPVVLPVFMPLDLMAATQPLVLKICYTVRCVKIERALDLLQEGVNTGHVLLLIRTDPADGTRYVLYKLDVVNIKAQSVVQYNATMCDYSDEQQCRASQCAWIGGQCTFVRWNTVNVKGDYGFSRMVIDGDTEYAYLSTGSAVGATSVLTKINTQSLTANFSRVFDSNEAIVAMHADTQRRALFLVSSVPQLTLSVVNMYDVVYASPHVIDAGEPGATEVTVMGAGIPLGFQTSIKVGDVVSNCTTVASPSGAVLQCVTNKPDQYSSCQYLPLEMSIGPVDRWTENSYTTRHVTRPTVHALGTYNTSGDWTVLRASDEIAVPGPLEYMDVVGSDVVMQHRADRGTFGPFNRDVLITISGSDFLATDTMGCRIDGVRQPGTVITTMRAVCLQPATHHPFTSPVEVTLDGQIYASSGTNYTAVGPAAQFSVFSAVCTTECAFTTTVVVRSAEVNALNITALFKDQLGTALGDIWADSVVGDATIESARGIKLEGTTHVGVSGGKAVFDAIYMRRPLEGEYSVSVSYPPKGLTQTIMVTVVGGDPHALEFVTRPPPFANNRGPLTVQPVFKIVDIAGNKVVDGGSDLYIKASVVDVDGHLLGPSGDPTLEVTGSFGEATAESWYAFDQLAVASTSRVGRDLQYKVVTSTVPHTEQQVYFSLRFEVGRRSAPIETQMFLESRLHMVDCSFSYIGSKLLAWVEPEEMPIMSSTPVTIKGWQFTNLTTANGYEAGQYKCTFRHASNGSFALQVPATFVDSCTLVCDDLPLSFRSVARMTEVAPGLCCQGPTQLECPGETDAAACHTTTTFNESSIKVKYYHRYVGKASRLGVWNTELSLPRIKEDSPYVQALEVQYDFAQAQPFNYSHALGIRKLTTGDYVNDQRSRDAYDYKLLQLTDALMHQESVIRADEWVTISGGPFWKEEGEWQFATTAKWLQAQGTFDLIVAVLDDSVGLNDWNGAWLAGQDMLYNYETNSEFRGTPSVVEVELQIHPQNTTFSTKGQLASVKYNTVVPIVEVGGSTAFAKKTLRLTSSIGKFPMVRMRAPAKGTYVIVLTPSSHGIKPVQMTITILEGVPHHAAFPSEAVIPTNTLTTDKELTVQPQFALLDAVDNIVSEFTKHNPTYVRVKDIVPWPRCKEACSAASLQEGTCTEPQPSDPGMWGVEDRAVQGLCGWNTPPLADTSPSAQNLRRVYDPMFADGTAGYGRPGTTGSVMTIWAQEGMEYNVTWEFYGDALTTYGYQIPPLSLPNNITVSTCPENCTGGPCGFSPAERTIYAVPEAFAFPFYVYGDFYSFALSEAGNDKIRVSFTIHVNQTNTTCDVGGELRDPCTIVSTQPTCKYLCINLYSPAVFTVADRLSCCKSGITEAGVPCGTLGGSRAARTLDAADTSAILTSPSRATLRVSTNCLSGTDCTLGLLSATSMTGPQKIGPPVQLGVSESMLAAPAVGNTRQAARRVGPYKLTVTSKDFVGNDVGSVDTEVRKVRVYIEGQQTLLLWDTADCINEQCLPHGSCDGTNDCVEFDEGNTVTLVNGVGVISFYLISPKPRVYGVHLVDESGTLPSCSGPYLAPDGSDVGRGPIGGRGTLPFVDSVNCAVGYDLRHVFNFAVTHGKVYKLAWNSAPVSEVSNAELKTVEYNVEVQDAAGNALSKDYITGNEGVAVFVAISKEVPELRDPVLGPIMFGRRGVAWTEDNIRNLEDMACSFALVEATPDFPTQSHLGTTGSPTQARFSLSRFTIWNGMTCELSFTADIRDADLNPIPDLTDEVNNATGVLKARVKPALCCQQEGSCDAFAYSFEFGCWNHQLGRVIDGPRNPTTSDALKHVSKNNRYACLTSCGVCEEGMVCYGNVTIRNLEGYWREPVTYRGHECVDGCVASSLGNGLGDPLPTAMGVVDASEHNRSTLQCQEGSEGPICGICQDKTTSNAPYGYGKDLGACVKCSSPTISYVLLAIAAVVVLFIVVVLVMVNISHGARVKETPKVSVMMKMFMNHLHVSALAGDFTVQWGNIIDVLFSSQGKGSPSSNVLSIDCLWHLNYYTKFIMWMTAPVAVIVLPAMVLGFIKLTQKVQDDVTLGDVCTERICECQSPYHWMYDWCVPERDKAELRTLVENQKNQPKELCKTKKLNIEMRKLADPHETLDVTLQSLKKSDAEVPEVYVPSKIQRVTVHSHEAKDMEVHWETSVTLGTYGCWLCKSCCLLEQLFPTPGVGCVGAKANLEELIQGHWYTCDVPDHELNIKSIQSTFREELLEACLARYRLMEYLRFPFIDQHIMPDKVTFERILFDCFSSESRSRGKRKHKKKKGKEVEVKKNEELDMLIRAILNEGSASRSEGHAARLQTYATATMPPYPVTHHKSFPFPDATRAQSLHYGISHTVVTDGLVKFAGKGHPASLVSLAKKREDAIGKLVFEEGAGSSVKVTEDKLQMTKQRTVGADSFWKVQRVDIMTGVEKEWFTHQTPLTPPTTPRGKEKLNSLITIPLPAAEKEAPTSGFHVPSWYMDAEFDNISKEPTPSNIKMLAMPSETGKDVVFSLKELSKLPFDQLYTTSRLRRASDKIQGWKEKGYTDQQLRDVLTDHDIEELGDWLAESSFVEQMVKSPGLMSVVPTGSFMGSPVALENSRFSFAEERGPTSDSAKSESLDNQYEARAAALLAQDNNMNVIEECGLCHADFAVWFCPHHDDFFCERCDKALHRYGHASRHLRLHPQPKISPLAESGGTVRQRMRDVYKVTVLVVIFLVYPSLMKEVAMMLTCSDPVCVDSDNCHRFLLKDLSINCDEGMYYTYWYISLITFMMYGLGLPFAGWYVLSRNRHKLRTKKVMSTLGFLYSGYRQKRYYWEMVITLRKMVVVFVVVFLTKYPRYQLWAAMWVMAVFVFMNILLRPYKYRVLWALENVSLISIFTTLNLGLLYLDKGSTWSTNALTAFIMVLNISVVMIFLYQIASELKRMVIEHVDKDGDGSVSMEEALMYVQDVWNQNKPSAMRSKKDVKREETAMRRKQEWLGIDERQRMKKGSRKSAILAVTAEYGYRMDMHEKERRHRFRVLRGLHDVAPSIMFMRKAFTADELRAWWTVAYGGLDTSSTPPSTPTQNEGTMEDVSTPGMGPGPYPLPVPFPFDVSNPQIDEEDLLEYSPSHGSSPQAGIGPRAAASPR